MIVESVETTQAAYSDATKAYLFQTIVFRQGDEASVKRIGVVATDEATSDDEVFDEWLWLLAKAAREAAVDLGESPPQSERLSTHEFAKLFGVATPREVYETVTPAKQWRHRWQVSER